MSSNVGLSTPRGSGTSGYVQRNLSYLKPRDRAAPYPPDLDKLKHKPREPDKKILEHDRARAIEVEVFELRDRLEDEGVDDEEVESRTEALRRKLTKASEGKISDHGDDMRAARGLKKHQVHELAAAKLKESERLRQALGISKDYEEGSHWKRQEDRLRDTLKTDEQPEKRRDEELDDRSDDSDGSRSD